MPRISLYRNTKTNDYRYFDKIVSESYTMGGVEVYIHKYIGPAINPKSKDATQPIYDSMDPTNIQDLLFLENRDRKYDKDIYRLRMHYTMQDLDFDLSQFGLFLSNDIVFLTTHYNDMIDFVGRKLMVGDVIELPHLTDYHPLNETIPITLRRYYQITDANYASEGFSPTWLPHIWRIKCEPLINSQEFADILTQPEDKDNYLGDYDKDKKYPPGYKVSEGGKNYISKKEVPVAIKPPNEEYWQLDAAGSLTDILDAYNKNNDINNAIIAEATRLVPKSGYNTQNLYVVPTDEYNEPALPTSVVINSQGGPNMPIGTIESIQTVGYKNGSWVARINKKAAEKLSISPLNIISVFMAQTLPERNKNGSGLVSGHKVLTLEVQGVSDYQVYEFPLNLPFGTADNDNDDSKDIAHINYSSADQDITQSQFTGMSTEAMNYLADCDPRFRYIERSSPKTFGYLDGYLTGDGTAPNGLPFTAGVTFPDNPKKGQYFLRTDYLPNVMFRWDGRLWVKISENVRTGFGLGANDGSLKSTFINNSNVTILTDGTTTSERQSLSTILTIKED
jgi:hypothetical protein